MEFGKLEKTLIVLAVIAVLTAGISLFLQNTSVSFTSRIAVVSNSAASNLKNVPNVPPPPPPPQKLSNPPSVVRAVYVTGYSAGTKRYLAYLTDLFKNTDINAVVVDVKGSDGYVTYASGAPDVKKYNLSDHAIYDIDALVNFLHSKNIYVIGRIAAFEDPVYSKAKPELAIYNTTETTDPSRPVLWKDSHGLSWLNPASQGAWDYDISLAKDAFSHGFDEINFDYVRFPSDGKVSDMGFPGWDEKIPMADIIRNFFRYTREQLLGEKISVDVFGQTTTNTDDMGIGQIIENAFQNFDYVAPMVYPSHYINGFMGFDNPAEHPYDIINYSMGTALNREKAVLQKEIYPENRVALTGTTSPSSAAVLVPMQVFAPLAKFRPWLQDFNMGADYNADMVKAEIKATQDSLGTAYSGFMLWNPINVYTQDAVK